MIQITQALPAGPIDPQCAAIIAGQIAARGPKPLDLQHFNTPRLPIPILLIGARQYPLTRDLVTQYTQQALARASADDLALLEFGLADFIESSGTAANAH